VKRIQILIFVFALAVFISGCTLLCLTPPTPDDAEAFLKNNQHDIDVVVSFLKSIDTADHAYIDRNDTTVFYEFEYHEITPKDVRTSLRHLWSAGCECISIQNGDNTVYFEMWRRTMGNVSCGISCTLNGQGVPKAELQTECTPISKGWFYYFADYEEYRKSPSKYDEMWDTGVVENETGAS